MLATEDISLESENALTVARIAEQEKEISKRLLSLDALRGLDIFFIMGGAGIFTAIAQCWPSSCTQEIALQMKHPAWHGFTFYDLIFPFFLFLAGISFTFSLAKQQAQKKSSLSIYGKIVWRAVILVFLGILFNNTLIFDINSMRICSVLGHIGLAWMFAALIYMNTGLKRQIAVCALILIGYWLLICLVPAPDANPGAKCAPFMEQASKLFSPDEQITKNLTMEGSIVGYVDRTIMPGKLYREIHDPEGLLTLIPAIITALFGMMAGALVQKDPSVVSSREKILRLILWGVFLVGVGILWSTFFPLNKNLWTSSFVCLTGGIAVIVFALFYLVIDVLQFRRWSFFLVVIGMNSITIYMAQRILGFDRARNFCFSGISSLCPETIQPLIMAVGYVVVCWWFLFFLYRHRVFLKI
ncbi:MAG: DUF5009 domain-containing protein [Planctomycetia bacterium]|nr:DUF5009 domain-containing protein [Planctomycetia bacterium]